ncbi:DUF2177 family protein [Candidatus Bipolaricaulota bacterium]|nr:DUF2177 family protein [Candidatus Bipolaricaulota bacterium]MCF7890337.1 DUF2177 family protein [Candidatus Bipolaricaulota bacterium]
MDLLNQIYLYLICLGTFLAVDFLWLGVVARKFYRQELGELMAESTNWTAAIVFYLLFVVGLLVFVINPALEKSSLIRSIGFGFLFGIISYATYDLTNLATLSGWSLKVTGVDLVWGGFLSAIVSTVGYLAASAFLT